MATTIIDIAKACGTSKTTVSKVLTGNDARISEAKRKMIHEAMGRLNYRPSAVARALTTKRSNAIGVVTSRVPHMVSRPYYAELLDGVLDESTVASQRLTLYNSYGPNGPSMDPLLFADGHCDGLIVLGIPDPGTLAAITNAKLPCVVVNGGQNETVMASIQIDNEQSGYDATRHLIELGHTRIGYLHMNNILCSDERLAGYWRALDEAGIARDNDLVFSSNYDPTAAHTLAMEIAAKPSLGMTALFCVTDEFALSAIQGFRDAGVKVPDDISIMGLDGVIEGERSFPRLTTMSQSLNELGGEAVRCLMDAINEPFEEPRRIVWSTKLIIRDSVKRLN